MHCGAASDLHRAQRSELESYPSQVGAKKSRDGGMGAPQGCSPSPKGRARYHEALYQLTCERNLEGIVCKQRNCLYDTRRPIWVKIKSPNYTQAEGRGSF